MAICSNCGTETQLYANGVPLCPSCDNTSLEGWQQKCAERKPKQSASSELKTDQQSA
jgi:hypothetical protein